MLILILILLIEKLFQTKNKQIKSKYCCKIKNSGGALIKFLIVLNLTRKYTNIIKGGYNVRKRV